MYTVTKRLGPFSATFRNWRAEGSHCRFLHGHDLYFEITVVSEDVDPRGWVFDYAQFKPIRTWIDNMFDHKVIIAHDDPFLDAISALAGSGVLDCVVQDTGPVSCESFARNVYEAVEEYFATLDLPNTIQVDNVRCYEQDNNSSVYDKKSLA